MLTKLCISPTILFVVENSKQVMIVQCSISYILRAIDDTDNRQFVLGSFWWKGYILKSFANNSQLNCWFKFLSAQLYVATYVNISWFTKAQIIYLYCLIELSMPRFAYFYESLDFFVNVLFKGFFQIYNLKYWLYLLSIRLN